MDNNGCQRHPHLLKHSRPTNQLILTSLSKKVQKEIAETE